MFDYLDRFGPVAKYAVVGGLCLPVGVTLSNLLLGGAPLSYPGAIAIGALVGAIAGALRKRRGKTD
ncbi:MAG: hypothetical protein AAGI51_04250 [Pseudomonadota bacterium]